MGSKKHLSTDSRTGVTRADITNVVYRRHGGLTKTEAAEIVNKIFDTMKSNLLNGRPVKIQNFGVFEIASRKGRAGVNPVTGDRIYIPAHRSLQFRPAPRLKDAVQDPEGGH